MKLGIFLNIGESLTSLAQTGQDERFINHYLKGYRKKFNKIFIFSYKKEKWALPDNCFLIPNRHKIHRFFYTFLLPFLNNKALRKCQVLRATQLTGAIPGLIAKLLYRKYLVTTYGYDYKKFSLLEGKSYLKPLISFLEFLTSRLSDKIIVTNQTIKRHLLEKTIKEKIIYLPNGVDTKLFNPGKKNLKTRRGKIKILFVGRLVKQKNLFTLVEAVSLLEDKKDIILKFVGDGNLKKELINYALLKKINLQIIKKVPYGKMPVIFQASDLFVLPSLIEGHPKVLLEALSCGLPCIVNRIESTESIIQDYENGFFFENSAKSLSEKIKMILKKDNQNKILQVRKNARRLVHKQYNLSTLLDKEIRLLTTVSQKN